MLDGKPGGEAVQSPVVRDLYFQSVWARDERLLSSPDSSGRGFHRLSAVGNIMGRGAIWEMKSRTLKKKKKPPPRYIPSTFPHPVVRVVTRIREPQ